jgi:23S rRNA pseudouridine1911/1915/1917 synthase
MQGGKAMINVLYEDNHIIVVEKPENIPSQKDSSNDKDMLSLIKDYIKAKYNKPGNVYAGLVHRLDRPTGGIMVFARTSKAAKRLTEQIQNNQFHKRYLAVVNGYLDEDKGTFKDNIKRLDNGDSIISEDGKEAILNYRVLSKNDNTSLVDIELITGRHHQIRVQFANKNHPLCGDQRYGNQDNTQLALYAYQLEFVHPVKKEKMVFKNLPNDYGYFKKYKKELAKLCN